MTPRRAVAFTLGLTAVVLIGLAAVVDASQRAASRSGPPAAAAIEVATVAEPQGSDPGQPPAPAVAAAAPAPRAPVVQQTRVLGERERHEEGRKDVRRVGDRSRDSERHREDDDD